MGPLDLKPVGVWTALTKPPAKSTDKYLKVTKPNRLPRILPKERLMLTDTGTGKGPEVVKVTTAETKGNKGGKGVKRKKKISDASPKKKQKMDLLRAPKSQKKKKGFRDDIDLVAEKMRTGQRVSWSAKEDSILLTCKIASTILGMGSQREHPMAPVPYYELRNILHKYCKEKSKDKSTEACKRRISFIMKNPRTEHNMSVFLSEALQDPKIEKEYAHKKVSWMTEDTIKEFNNLFELLIKKFSTVDLKQSYLPSHLSELPDFNIKVVKKMNLNAVTHKDVESSADMYIAVLRNIVQTYASLEDKQGRVYECFKLLNQYPRDCIVAATAQLRTNKVITRIKAHEHKKQRMPSTLQNYKISQKYWYGYLSRFPASLFEDSVKCLHQFEKTFLDPSQHMTFNNITQGGYCACIIAMMSLGIVSFHSQIPRDMIILDPCNVKSWRGLCDPRIDPKKGAEGNDKSSPGTRGPTGVKDVTQGPVPMDIDSTTGVTQDPDQGPIAPSSNRPSTALTPGPEHISPMEVDNEAARLNEPYWTPGELMKVMVSPTSCLEMEDLPRQLSFPGTPGKNQMTPSRSLITIRRSCAEDAQNLKHFKFQDNFVISSCNIRMKIKQEVEGLKERSQEERTVSEIMKEVLMSPEEMKQIVQKLTRTLPFELDMEIVWESISPPLLAHCQRLYNEIDRHRSLGISKFDLQELFVAEDWYYLCLDLLNDKFAILKVGVTVQRYVSFRNARPWVTHAYKNVKGRGVRQTTQVDDSFDADSQLLQESLANPLGYRDTSAPTLGPSGDATPAPSSTDSLSCLPASDQSEELTSDIKDPISTSDQVIAKSNKTSGNNPDQQDLREKGDKSDIPASNIHVKGNQSEEGSLQTSPQANTDRPRRGREQRKSVMSDGLATPKPTSTYQRVRLLCSPWRKPEGNINKPLFKTMVESMMQKIMASPGISFQTLCENYTAYNPPFLKQQILEILEDIKAVKKSILRRQIKPTLFSKRVSPQIVTIDKADDTVVYFPTEVCITRLGQFMEYISKC